MVIMIAQTQKIPRSPSICLILLENLVASGSVQNNTKTMRKRY